MTLLAAPRTILAVDDGEGVCELIEILLVRVGYHALTATNGPAALRLADETPEIDLLICNLDLPDGDAFAVVARVALLHPASSVVFLLSYAAAFPTTPPNASLAKPFTIAQLRDTVRRALQARPSLAETAQAA